MTCCSTHPSPTESSPGEMSLRWPALFGLTHAVFWLAVAGVLQALASTQLAWSPTFLAECSALSYGRLQPASVNALIYGFSAQCALVVVLWLIVRLGGARLKMPFVTVFAFGLWNLGVLAGTFGILSGDASGFAWSQMPRYSSPLIFLSYLLIAVTAIHAWKSRDTKELHPSQWFALAALFVFPWVFTVGVASLQCSPVRGVAQLVVDAWVANNISLLFLGSTALGAIFHFVPRLSGRPLASYEYALFAFWTLVVVGPWTGMPVAAPIPAWVSAVGSAADAVLVLVAAVIGWNVWRTVAGNLGSLKPIPGGCFFIASTMFFLLWSVSNVVATSDCGSARLSYTFFGSGLKTLFLLGFVGSALFGTLYQIVPVVTGARWHCLVMVRLHLKSWVFGLFGAAVAMMVAGVKQGEVLANPALPSTSAFEAATPWVRLSTIAMGVVGVGVAAMCVNLMITIVKAGRACIRSAGPAGKGGV